jgi:hypothetical protein
MERLDAIHNEPGIAGNEFVSLSRIMKRQRGAIASGRAREIMTTSDFSFMADTMDRGLMVSYMDETVPITYDQIGLRRDTAELARANGKGRGRDYQINAARLIPPVEEKGEYLPIDPTDTYYEMKTRKFGCQWDISWEAWLSDGRDLGMLKSYPEGWGLSARYTQEYVATWTWAANATLFTAPHGNLNAAAGGALTGATLDAAVTAIRNQTDPAGNVGVYGGPLFLVVPPALERTALALVNSALVITGANVTIPSGNPVQNIAKVITNTFLPSLDATYGNTGWYLFADPRIRPAFRYGFLRGYEQPEIFVKAAEAQRLLGGGSDPYDGSFLTDDIAFKMRFTFGADLLMYQGAYWSQGRAAVP